MPTLFAKLYDGEDDDLYEKEDFEVNLEDVDPDADEDEVYCIQCGEIVEDGVQCPVCGWIVEIIEPLPEVE